MRHPVPATASQALTVTGPLVRRLLITAPRKIELTEERLPPLGPHDVHAQMIVSGISHGTEMAWLTGAAAALRRQWDASQRIYRDGPGRDYPVAPGYESVGRVIQTGPAVTTVLPGDLITIDAPHADRYFLAEAAATAGRIPPDMDPELAVFFTLARVALGGVHDAALAVGETVVIIGLGTVGLLAAQQARLAGARVIGVDRYPLRLAAAASLGIATAVCEPGADIGLSIRSLTGPAGADAAIEASGSYAGLHEAIRCLRVGGRVATVASYHGDQPGLRLGEEYHRNRITLISSMTVNGCPQRRHPAWTFDRLNDAARDLILTGAVQVSSLITHRVPFADAARAYALIADTPQDTIKVVLTYDND